jgi:hypothetical protein
MKQRRKKMWYVFKATFFSFMAVMFMLLGAFNILPDVVAIISSVGMFACMGLTVAQLFCEDL